MRSVLAVACVLVFLGVVTPVSAECPAPVAQQAQSEEVRSGPPAATPMREVSTAQVYKGKGFFGWIDPVKCDQDANVYLLVAPHATVHEVEAAATAGRDLPLITRKVLRVSADGKRTSFDPAVGPKLTTAKTLTTVGITVGHSGTLYLLVWATWGREDGQTEKRGLYILSFDKKGTYRSEVEVDWQEILVRQFEVFGSGDFLLVGRRGGTDEKRVAILDASGGELRDVTGWSGYPAGLAEKTSQAGTVLFDYMVRGGDGRIYVAEQDARLEDVAVYAFEPSGVSSEVIRLRPMKNRQLSGLRAAGDNVAALYREASPGEKGGRWWIAVFNSVLGGEMQSLYGPVPTQPFCYQREGSGDRFTSLNRGKLVTMAP